MSGESPAVILYDYQGTALAVYNNTAIPVGTPALMFAGSDGTNSQFAKMTPFGSLSTAQASNNVVVESNATITSSGSTIITNAYFGTQEIDLVVNVTQTPTGTSPTLVFTIQEVDPGDGTTVYGNSASTTTINGGNTPGVFIAKLSLTSSSAVKVSWTIGGTSGPTFTGVYVTITTKSTPATQVISGSITATNPSVGSDGAAALTFDTQVGGVVSTSAPSYTNGNLNALSLTTAGALRVDGSGVTQPVSGTVAVSSVGGTVTVSGTVATTQSTSPWIVAGGGTAGSPASGVVTVQGISGGTAMSVDSDGYVTTSAPSYSNGTWNHLSLDTSGNLRVLASQGTTPWAVVTNKATNSSVTSVASSASNVTLLAANANRVFASIYNESSKTVYVKMGSGASNTSYSIFLMPNSYWEVPSDWTGQIDAVWSAANGSARVTELTP